MQYTTGVIYEAGKSYPFRAHDRTLIFVGYHIVRVFVLFYFILYVYPRVEKIMFIFTLVLLLCAFNCEIKVFRRCGILCFSIYLINAQFD
jgi:hypothetical protein